MISNQKFLRSVIFVQLISLLQNKHYDKSNSKTSRVTSRANSYENISIDSIEFPLYKILLILFKLPNT